MRYRKTFHSAGVACLGASLAMGSVVLPTLIATGFAYLCTQSTHSFRLRAIAGHDADGQLAHGGAICIHGNAPGHHPNVLFLQATI
jgi:hypothetical protein